MMKKFLFRISLYVLLAVLSVVALFTFLPKALDDYDSVYTAKLNRLKSLERPRIVIVSGSAAAFGLDSKRISDSLHINVVNAAVTSGFGTKYWIDDIEQYISEGDLVVFIPDYKHFFHGGAYGSSAGDLTSAIEQTSWKNLQLLNAEQLHNVVSGIPMVLRSKIFSNLIRSTKPSAYRASGFNEYGDQVSHWELPSPGIVTMQPITEDLDEDFFQYFLEKVNRIEHQTQMVFIPPVFVESYYTIIEGKINEFSNRLSESNHYLLANPADFVVDDSCAFDGAAHMNKVGVDIYTGKVIDVLRPVVEEFKRKN